MDQRLIDLVSSGIPVKLKPSSTQRIPAVEKFVKYVSEHSDDRLTPFCLGHAPQFSLVPGHQPEITGALSFPRMNQMQTILHKTNPELKILLFGW